MKYLLSSTLFIFFIIPGIAQEGYKFPSPSPLGTITQVVGNTTIKVSYERPSMRGREIYGGLVPWDKIWRTGAAYCTKVSFDNDVTVGGQTVEAGTYSIFTIPNPDEWMVMLNRDTMLYGSYYYDPGLDVARFLVRPQTTDRTYEALTIDIDVIPNNAKMYISWANTAIAVDIKTSTDEDLRDYINQYLITGKSEVADDYINAASELFTANQEYNLALSLIDRGLSIDPDKGWAIRIKKEINLKKGYYKAALEALAQQLALTKRRDYDDEKYRVRDLESQQKEYAAIEAMIETQKN